MEFWAPSHTHGLKNTFRLMFHLIYNVSGMLFCSYHVSDTMVHLHVFSQSASATWPHYIDSLEIKQPCPESHTNTVIQSHSQSHTYTAAQSQSHTPSLSVTHTASHSHCLKNSFCPYTLQFTTGLLITHCPTASHLVPHSTPTSAHPAPQLGSSCSKSLLFFLSLFFFPSFPSEKPGPCQETQALPYSGPRARQE